MQVKKCRNFRNPGSPKTRAVIYSGSYWCPLFVDKARVPVRLRGFRDRKRTMDPWQEAS